jgi:chromosomal replication initiator protein
MEIVSAVRTALAGRVGKERFAVWFGRGVRMEPCGTTLRIAAADAFRLDFLKRNFRADLLDVTRVAGGDGWQVEFIVDPAMAVAAVGPTLPIPLALAEPENANQELLPDAKISSPPLPHRPPKRQFASLTDFQASDANRVAFTAALTAATRPGTYTPLTFVGPPGSGKTHLLEGIWRHVRQSRTLQRVIYFTAEQFTNQFIDALRKSGTPNFRHKIRNVELLLIDDVQFFAGKQSTITELVHTIDTLLREGRQLAFSLDRPPAELRALGQELVTRIAGGLICTLQPADFNARLGILRQLIARHGTAVPEDVQSWLAGQLQGDARHLAGALHRLQAASQAHERPIDLDFAQHALDDLIHASRRPVRLPEIVEAVCDVFGVRAEEVQSGSKASGVTMPRMLIMFLARKWTRAALSEISRTLGRKSHTTVLSAQEKVTQWLEAGMTVPLAHGECRVEDAIKRVEAQLRLG